MLYTSGNELKTTNRSRGMLSTAVPGYLLPTTLVKKETRFGIKMINIGFYYLFYPPVLPG